MTWCGGIVPLITRLREQTEHRMDTSLEEAEHEKGNRDPQKEQVDQSEMEEIPRPKAK